MSNVYINWKVFQYPKLTFLSIGDSFTTVINCFVQGLIPTSKLEVRRSLVTRIFRSLVARFRLSLVTRFMSRCISHAQARAKCVSVFLAWDAPLFVACDAVYLDAHFACAGACKVRVSQCSWEMLGAVTVRAYFRKKWLLHWVKLV